MSRHFESAWYSWSFSCFANLAKPRSGAAPAELIGADKRRREPSLPRLSPKQLLFKIQGGGGKDFFPGA
jgi:hypothetical protein